MRNLSCIFLLLILCSSAQAQQYEQELQQQQQNDQLLNTLQQNPATTSTGPAVTFEQSNDPVANPGIIAAPQTPPPEQDETFPEPPPAYEQQKYAVLQTLDKVTARTATVTLPVGKPSAVGPLFVEVQTCQKTPPTEQPEAAAFLQVWEAKPKNQTADNRTQSQWVFSGWMFASSPALSAMNHPIYDVWVKDCVNEDATSKQK